MKTNSFLISSLLVTSLLVISCAEDKPNTVTNSKNQSSSGDENDDNNYIVDNSNGNINSNQNIQNKISITSEANEVAKADCSNAGAKLNVQILNIEPSQEIQTCPEFILLLPNNSPRFGETSSCDTLNKFVKLEQNADWSYNLSAKKWTLSSGSFSTKNSFIVPGLYRLIVKDSKNNIHTGPWVQVGRHGHDTCNSDTTSSKIISYQWIANAGGSVVGPVAIPTQPCGSANVGATLVLNSLTYTCLGN
jgi:hypothetical protein